MSATNNTCSAKVIRFVTLVDRSEIGRKYVGAPPSNGESEDTGHYFLGYDILIMPLLQGGVHLKWDRRQKPFGICQMSVGLAGHVLLKLVVEFGA